MSKKVENEITLTAKFSVHFAAALGNLRIYAAWNMGRTQRDPTHRARAAISANRALEELQKAFNSLPESDQSNILRVMQQVI